MFVTGVTPLLVFAAQVTATALTVVAQLRYTYVMG